MFKKFIILLFIIAFINIFVCPISFARDVILENGTRVRLKLIDKVSSNTNNEGEQVNFIVADDIKLGDTVLIKEGTKATGIISELIPRGTIGKAGRLTINVESTEAVTGKKVQLSGMIPRKGEDKMILSVALSLLAFPPLSLIFLTMRGTDATLPAGYQYNARVDRDVILSLDENIIPALYKR